MATIKSYTDLEQSKKLAEILPLESADMRFKYDHNEHRCIEIPMMVVVPNWDDEYNKDIPCWSVGALLELMPNIKSEDGEDATPFIAKVSEKEYYIVFATMYKEILSSKICTTAIDACYDMMCFLLENNYIKR